MKKTGKFLSIVMICTMLLPGLVSIKVVANNTTTDLKASVFFTCFKFGTKITMADGTQRNIETIKKGDILLSYDVNKGEFKTVKVYLVSHPVRPVININNGFLYVTEDHPLRIQKPDGTIGWGQIDVSPNYVKLRGQNILKIEVNDYLFTENTQWVKITSIDRSDKTNVSVVDIFTFSGKGTYFANGILAYEENVYPRFWLMYYCYKFCDIIPVLNNYKDLFLF